MSKIIRFLVRLTHRIFGCPAKYLTEKKGVRISICNRCLRVHYKSKEVEEALVKTFGRYL